MEKREKIWKAFDSELFKTFQEYEENEPIRVLEFIGDALDDLNRMLEHSIVTRVLNSDSYPMQIMSTFYIEVPKGNNYNVRVFEIVYDTETLYPCKLHSLLTENKFECSSKSDLQEKIIKEISNNRFKQKISNLLYYFYDKEEIEKLMKNSEYKS